MAAHRPDVIASPKAFVAEQPSFNAARLVFLDESGVCTAESRRYGWARRGKRPIIERPARGRRLNIIGAIGLDGVRAIRTLEGYVNGEVFLAFLRDDLGPKLNPGDIVVMDGPSIHRVEGVSEVLAERGAKAIYLPAYSPELNPIEMTWAWIKKQIRDFPRRRMAELAQVIAERWGQVTPALCRGWLKHAGYTWST